MNEALVEAAKRARANAYCPYSGYSVGAAIEDEHGRVWIGANVENVSYGATICAERSALAAMVSAGGREIRSLALSTHDGGLPCGICLQALNEFVSDPREVMLTILSEVGSTKSFQFVQLFPFGFRSSEVPRTGNPL